MASHAKWWKHFCVWFWFSVEENICILRDSRDFVSSIIKYFYMYNNTVTDNFISIYYNPFAHCRLLHYHFVQKYFAFLSNFNSFPIIISPNACIVTDSGFNQFDQFFFTAHHLHFELFIIFILKFNIHPHLIFDDRCCTKLQAASWIWYIPFEFQSFNFYVLNIKCGMLG